MDLQEVHMERLVTETCRCDLLPSVSRPLHRDPAQQRSGGFKIPLEQVPHSRPTLGNTHSSSGIGAYLNAFSFNNEFYHQVGGVAMGSKMGPNYSCLFVGFIEEQLGQQYTSTVPQLHKWYNDNVVGIACCSHVEIED